MNTSTKRNAIIVMGMHRSGTSAITRAISILGYQLPKTIMGASKGNELGHWESAALSKLNDSILAELGLSWDSWQAIRIENIGSLRKSEIVKDLNETIANEFPGNKDFVLKDPRASRLTSFLLPALSSLPSEAKILFPLRNPLEICDSLNARNNMSKGQAILLWLRYMLDAEYGTRGHDRTFFTLEDFLTAPTETLKSALTKIGVQTKNVSEAAQKKLQNFVQPDMRHHKFSSDALLLDPTTQGWVSDAMNAFLTLSEDSNDKAAMESLDRIKGEFEDVTPILDSALHSTALTHQKTLEDLGTELSNKDSLIADRQAAVDKLASEIESLQQSGAEKDQLITERQAAVNKLASEIESLQQSGAEKDQLITERQAAVDKLASEIESLQQSGAEKDQLITERQAAVDKLSLELQGVQNIITQKNEKLLQVEGELSQVSNTLKQKGQELSDIKKQYETEKEELTKKLKNKDTQVQKLENKHVETLKNVSSYISEIDQLNQKILDLQNQFETSSSLLKESKENEEILINQLEATLTDRNNIETTTKNLQNDNALKEEQIKALEDEKHSFADRSKVLSEEVEVLKKNFNDAQDAISVYSSSEKGLQSELKFLRARLKDEQRTVIKPLLRNVRSAGGSVLRSFLPNKVVENLAFLVPTSEQKQILKQRKIDSNVEVISPETLTEHKNSQDKPDIFIFAIIGWHFRTQRPQHIARELSRKGHRVFYFEMDPPGETTLIEEIEPGLTRIKLKLDGVPQIPAYMGVATAEQEKAWLKAFYAFCDSVEATPHKELIIQHPFWWQLAKLLPKDFRTLYDCMDDVAGFDNSTPELIALEHEFLSNVDQLIVSSKTLFDKYKRFKPLDIVRNATELEHFTHVNHDALTEEFKIKNIGLKNTTLNVGYVGAISEWFDSDLIEAVAKERPDIKFHMCGHVSAEHPKRLGALPNVHLYGEIPYEQVPAFLSQMDVLIIPFQIIPIIQACDPVKFYEYSALGKPTVTTPLPELERAQHLTFVASTPDEFIIELEKAAKAEERTGFVNKLKAFAAENTWADRAEQVVAVLDDSPKVSVIVLAYGDTDLTNATVFSLLGKGPVYPNMEVIIVNNDPTPGAYETLDAFAQNYHEARVIDAGENLGFAGGNNLGIEAATGDYVFLLNNDTFVSPGAIQSMVSHLQNNRGIGAIGPLTNNIGNEAKLDIAYGSMDEMIHSSRALMTGYRGKRFETRVVAYFAVMFRRSDLKKFGLLSLDYGRGMFEDDDHCHAIKSHGYSCAVAEDAFVHHHLSATFSKMDGTERQKLFDRNKNVFESKWGKWIPHQYREKRLESDLQFENSELLP